ncbi:hypothetical protein DR864_12855 [Runella rosea]|uniref:Virulence-associated protein E-like domain-containing protein n=1 Tax=Runella rosea TaxID=2259595 RepID=A0A344TIW1_9BACT|nr:VapE domain-containing protein [Runella rosea]AXE18582.1 hypothetical protein DR864_12855 [Runella rosea]
MSSVEKTKTANTPIIRRIQDFIFAEYDYRLNIITNHLERSPKSASEWEFVNVSDIEVELYEYGLKGFKDPLKALLGSKVIPKFDPFTEYFTSLPNWDKSQPDYIEKLSGFVRTDDDWWWKQMFKKWVVRVVGQATGKIPFNKQCLTLVGKQNDGKTTFLDFLIPNALKKYAKKGFDFGSKDGKISLVQNFLINLDELASFDKKELNNEFKTVLSEGMVKYRPLFQNTEVPFARRASFAASTNQFEFLTDETGNVRWLPFVVREILHDSGGLNGYEANNDIDLFWSQAYALLNDTSFECNMTKDDISHQETLNRRFLRTTTEMEVLEKYYKPSDKGVFEAVFLTASDIENELKAKVNLRLHRNQIGRALQIMGYNQESNYNSRKGYTVKGYFVTRL